MKTKKMHLLISFATLKSGGGQNVGLNFINGFDFHKYSNIEFYFAVAKGTQIENELKTRNFNNVIRLSRNAIIRIVQEMFIESIFIKLNKIDVIYTYFGHSFIIGKTPQICGVADSNILFPDIDFWEGYNGISRLKKRIIDLYRYWGYRRASGLVFENEAMERRASRVFGPKTDSIFIKPSICVPEDIDDLNFEFKKSVKYGLFLCGWQKNKGIMKIPGLIKYAHRRGFLLDICISTDLDKNNPICDELLREAEINNVSDHIHFIGMVNKKQIRSLYSKIDYVFLLSKLESFSNNIIEAWNFRKPLVISDEEWAHSICGKAALYVDRNDSEKIVDSILNATSNGSIKSIVEIGIKMLDSYPSIEEKIDCEIKYAEKIYDMGKI